MFLFRITLQCKKTNYNCSRYLTFQMVVCSPADILSDNTLNTGAGEVAYLTVNEDYNIIRLCIQV
jgi:hypothetical protein